MLEREEIYQRVWGYTMAHGDRSVDVFVRKLRSKLQQASPEWNYIHTHFGVGYRFAAERAGRGCRRRRRRGGRSLRRAARARTGRVAAAARRSARAGGRRGRAARARSPLA